MRPHRVPLLVALVFLFPLLPGVSAAHCDSLDGPVVRDARTALESRDPTPVLKWVGPRQEAEIRAAFKSALAVRGMGAEARKLADLYFFETLVRVHRAGEGEAFTGLKAAGSVDPGIAAADKALETASGAELAKEMSAAVEEGVRKRFEIAAAAKKHAGNSIEAGRKYVAAYVDYIHFVESVHRLAEHGAPHTHQEPVPPAQE